MKNLKTHNEGIQIFMKYIHMNDQEIRQIKAKAQRLETFDSSDSEMRIYVDGSLRDTTSSGQPGTVSRGNTFGYDAGNNNRYFNGDLDDARTYDKALSDTEINNLYTTGSI